MSYERHYLAGFTDYTGVSLVDICRHLQEWEKVTNNTISQLEKYRAIVNSKSELLENSREVLAYINFFTNLFSRYLSDIQRLVREVPSGVTEAHIEMVSQLYRSSEIEDHVAVRFKNKWIEKLLPHEEMRPLLDDVYAETRGMLIDYKDLCNLAPRLKTFVGSSGGPAEILPDFHLKPSFFGIGLNLNRLLARVYKWWKSWKGPS